MKKIDKIFHNSTLMLEKDYKPILVLKCGVKNAAMEEVQKMKSIKHKELDHLKDKYDIIILLDATTSLYTESVELIQPFF